ncbi:pyridoxal phosphate-dependent aminotransferase [Clostridium tarantellae]|uniref:Aminotransferase class I/II-fold pyridoxal phosphate-dependent enzyme n=1 Tax=Clostridium tarantellae TaxID=39493 RepID=A0A6I1MM84_9CLOT|nr:histidinol-phosphate transaminase [Clostridium tarantellae]MPQ43863.1 aminotransferase class I/II-fold pyridoxal phosphate-dependent enzyme [Clostridium tarantellae]
MSLNHGANLFNLSNKLGIEKNKLIDFSSNINPFGSSPKAKEAIINNVDMVSIYPDPEYKNLKKTISNYCECKIENILLGSGATELISSFIKVIKPKKALLLSPSYSEYEEELKKLNCEIVKFFTLKENGFKVNINELINIIKKIKCDLLIICNPNNPTGFALKNTEIQKILHSCEIFVMVDETYVEFSDIDLFSSTKLTNKYPNLFIIRGTSKFFSTPGIRLGYGIISNENIKNCINSSLDLWNINIFANIMGEIMFKDFSYINNTKTKIIKEKTYLLDELKSLNELKVYNSYGNFILCELKTKKITAKKLYEKLLKKNIIIRDCSSFQGLNEYFFRVCILTHEENKLLINSLKSILKIHTNIC